MLKTMLLIFLTLFSIYDLFNCYEEGQPNFNNTSLTDQIHKSIHEIDTLLKNFQQEIKNEKLELRTVDVEDENFKEDLGLLDYSLTPYWWQGISWKDAARQKTTDKTILPTPEGFGESNDPSNFYKTLGLDNFPRNKIPFYYPQAPFYSPGVTFEPLTTINFKVLPLYLRSPDETSPPTITAGPSMPLSLMEDTTLPSLIEDTSVPITLVHPSLLPALRESTAKPIKFSKISTTLRATKREVSKERTNDTPVLQIQGNRITPKPRTLTGTLSKAQAWVRDRRWTRNPTPGSSTSARSEETPLPLRTMPRMTESTHTAYTGNLLHEDDKGFLYVSVPSSMYTTTSTRTTLAGDVLFGADMFTTREVTNPNQPFHDIMNAVDEGYVIVFICELTRLVVLKEPRDVQEVVSHAEIIINRYMENNKLGFAGRHIQTAIIYLSRMMSEASFDLGVLRRDALYLQSLLKDRRNTLSDEVNSLIDYADMLFDDKKGEPLFDALRDFEDYPNTTKAAWQVCYNLLYNFIEPFREISYSERGQTLLDNLNKALYDRFGEEDLGYRRWMEDLMIMRDGVTPKLEPISLKKIIRMKRLRGLNRTTNQKVNENGRRQYYEYQTPWVPSLRSLLPITRRQKRFRVITPRQLWSNLDLNIVRPTLEYRRRRIRPTHPPNDMLQLFPQVPVDKKRTPRSPPPIVAASVENHSEQPRANPLKQSINHRRSQLSRRMKAKLFRRSSKPQDPQEEK